MTRPQNLFCFSYTTSLPKINPVTEGGVLMDDTIHLVSNLAPEVQFGR